MKPRYTANYCEENVWHLLRDGSFSATRRHVVFISNPSQRCPIWRQKGAADPTVAVVWDYHVVMLGVVSNTWQVFDLDSTLPFPCDADDYLGESFPLAGDQSPDQEPYFRIINDATFLATFACDRSHMRNEAGGWRSPPPPWECIKTPTATMNLWRFVDMREGFVGTVYDRRGLVRWLRHPVPDTESPSATRRS